MKKLLLLMPLMLGQITQSMLLTRTNSRLSYMQKKSLNQKNVSKEILYKRKYTQNHLYHDKDLVEIITINNTLLQNLMIKELSSCKKISLLRKQKDLILDYNNNPTKSKYIIMNLRISTSSIDTFYTPEIKIYPKN